ncbi:MAG: hypothetical protein V4467_03475 [Patescibacteria group bacterium]
MNAPNHQACQMAIPKVSSITMLAGLALAALMPCLTAAPPDPSAYVANISPGYADTSQIIAVSQNSDPAADTKNIAFNGVNDTSQAALASGNIAIADTGQLGMVNGVNNPNIAAMDGPVDIDNGFNHALALNGNHSIDVTANQIADNTAGNFLITAAAEPNNGNYAVAITQGRALDTSPPATFASVNTALVGNVNDIAHGTHLEGGFAGFGHDSAGNGFATSNTAGNYAPFQGVQSTT